MKYLYLLTIVLLYLPINLTNKLCSKGTSEKVMLFKFSLLRAVFGVVIGAFILFLGEPNYNIDFIMILTSLIFGIMLAVCLLLTFYAMQITTVAITTMFTAASVIIPIGFGIAFFDDALTMGKIFGLCLLLVSAYLIVGNSGNAKQKFTPKVFWTCMGVLITSGLGSVAIQSFANCSPNGNEALFMLLSYIIEAIVLLVFYWIILSKSHIKICNTPKIDKKLFIFGAIGTVVTFLTQQLQTSAAAIIPATVLFPFTTGSSVIMGVIVGWSLFKERLSVKNIIGIVVGIISLIMINSL